MSVDADKKITTGRSWRDLPETPPESESVPSVPAATPPPPAPLPDTAEATIGVDTTVETPTPPVVEPPRQDPRSGGPWPWLWAAGLAGAVALLAALFIWSPWSDDEAGVAGAVGDDDAAEFLDGVEEPVALAASRLLPSVVQIEHFGALGSGFVYAEGGRILTAAHVVAGAREVTVRTSDGTELIGRVLGGDPVADIAVIEVDADLPPALLALGRTPEVGQLAVAMGSPHGFEQSVTSGIVSGVDRELIVAGTRLEGLIQTDAPINQGSSGGPLADRSGEVIGINVAIATASGGSDGVGFAVGIDQAVEIAEEFTRDASDPSSIDPANPLFPGFDDPGGLLPPELRGLFDELFDSDFGDLEGGLPPELRGLFDGLFDGDFDDLERLLPPDMGDLFEEFFDGGPGANPFPRGRPGEDFPELRDLYDFFNQEDE